MRNTREKTSDAGPKQHMEGRWGNCGRKQKKVEVRKHGKRGGGARSRRLDLLAAADKAVAGLR